MHKKLIGLVSLLVIVVLVSFDAISEENKGAPNLTISSGKKGDVNFPHAVHQISLNNCKACHGLFPEKKGAIQEMITSGTLKKKQVMEVCRECHKEMSKNSKKTGPTQCNGCHKK